MDDIYVSDEKSNVPSGEIKPAAEPLILDLGEIKPLKGFVYAPKDNGEGGVIVTYMVETSVDGNRWEVAARDKMFDNIVNNPVSQEVMFDSPVQARMIRLTPQNVEAGAGAVGTESQTYGVSVFAPVMTVAIE